MKIGVLTGGGDCPGLNAVIRAIVRYASKFDHKVIGFMYGWRGVVENIKMPLNREVIIGLLPRGGTIIRTSRTNPFKSEIGVKKVLATFKKENLGALIAIGGEDTLGVADKLYNRYKLPIVGIPKTIDNDLSGTDFTFGFYTAVDIATEAIDRIHTTAESHQRVMIVEVMGRHAGWIAVYSGLAGGADIVLTPEKTLTIDEICKILKIRHKKYKRDFSIIVVSEGARIDYSKEGKGELVLQKGELDDFGHVRLGGVGQVLAEEIKRRTHYDTRVTVLGHVQRGGTPSALDRILATRYGIYATELVNKKQFGKMVALQGNKIVAVSLKEAVKELKFCDPDIYQIAEAFFY